MTEPAELRPVGSGPAETAGDGDREAWISAGRDILAGQSSASWAWADWIAAGADLWGDKAACQAAAGLGASSGKIRRYLKASRVYPLSRRRLTLTFSHHLEAVFLPEYRARGAARPGGGGRLVPPRDARSYARGVARG